MNNMTETSLSIIIIAILAVIASLAGLLRPGLYRDPAYLMPQIYSQDLVIGVPLLTPDPDHQLQYKLNNL